MSTLVKIISNFQVAQKFELQSFIPVAGFVRNRTHNGKSLVYVVSQSSGNTYSFLTKDIKGNNLVDREEIFTSLSNSYTSDPVFTGLYNIKCLSYVNPDILNIYFRYEDA